jgi:molybdopterin-guanine dinucleotide biosynthesis protein MobB
MAQPDDSGPGRVMPPVVSVVGRKNSGKTTLVVALAAELKRRGLRVASIKHSHHDFDIDHPGKDSWRHFHEGIVDAVLIASPGRIALVMRTDEADRDPERLIARFLADEMYDLVLVEAFKRAAFPRIEVFRTTVHDSPLYEPDDSAEATSNPRYLAIVTDAPHAVSAPFPVVALRPDDAHVAVLADLIQAELRRSACPG